MTVPAEEKGARVGSRLEWDLASVRALCQKAPLVDPTSSPDDTFEYVDVSSVDSEAWKIVRTVRYRGTDAPSRARKRVKAGDVILATIRPTLRRVAIVPDRLDGQIVSTAFCVLRCDSKRMIPHFLYYSLLSDEFTQRIANLQRGASYPAVADGDLLGQEILVPTLPEQRAIAATLSKIQMAIDVQARMVAALKKLKAATMAKLFRNGVGTNGAAYRHTPFGEVPAGWNTKRLSDCAVVQTGVAKGRNLGGAPTVEVPYLRVANVQDGYLDLSEIKSIRLKESELERYSLRAGDVLLTEGGDFDKLGRGYLWQGQVPGCVHQNHIFAVRTDRKTLLPEFFAYLAQSPYGKAYFLSVAHKTTNLACINSHKLKSFPVPLPGLEEQERIGGVLQRIDRTIDVASKRFRFLRLLFDSTLRLLMSGELRIPKGMIPHLSRSQDQPVAVTRPDEKLLQEIVRRVVEAVAPEKIILFGSAARGEMTRDSDLDLLIVKRCDRRRETANLIRRHLQGIVQPIDVVVATPEDIELHGNQIGLIYRPALREGKVLYAA